MSLCKITVDVLSPPATPPSSSSSSSSTTSLDMTGHQLTSMLDKNRLDYVNRVKHTFQQFTQQQKHVFLAELLGCCDNQLLGFVHTLIVPKLKIDFLQQLPPELALHVLSFVDDPCTLARAARVSRYWNRLLQDESMWKALCIKHRLEKRIPSQPSYRDYFRRRYNIDNAWHHGGRIISCRNSIGTALVTSLQIDGPYIVAGCDNQRIEVFCSSTGKHLRSLLGHGGGVWSLQFMKEEDSDEYLLVSGGCDREARVWELSTGRQRHVLRGHSSTIRCLKMRDSKLAVTGSRDNTLRIWDLQTGRLLHLCVGHQNSVRCIDLHGNKVASGSYDHSARLWDLDTGECLQTFTGHHSQIYAIAYDDKRVVTGSLDTNIRVWSPETGRCLAILSGHTSLVGHLQLLPSDPNVLVSAGSDGCLRVWDLAHYECKHRISAHDNSVTCLQYDDRRIVSGGSDGRVKLWDLETGRLIRSLTDPARNVWKLQFGDTKAVVIMQRQTSPDDTFHLQTAIELHDFDTSDEVPVL
ncbi:WD40-repeat-containing domain protein [Syncephalastrum racemosum]|uniref:WD40-repeat-containing domain protein n=1 Tax=Syncephalastrum racemosum TaxID=13706 RepID=A0A1X2HLQ4_SYNRA|nr:WD40-repeat-containing domain protein [Syncephalastrum racemosum]